MHFWPPPVHFLGIAGVHAVVESHTVAGPELTESPPLNVPQIGLSVHDVSYEHESGAPLSATKHPEGAEPKLQSPPSDAMDAADAAESMTLSARTTAITFARTPTHASAIDAVRAFAPTRLRTARLSALIVRLSPFVSSSGRASLIAGRVLQTRRGSLTQSSKYLFLSV